MSIVVVFEVVFPYYYYTDPPKEIDVIDMEEFGYNKCDVSKQKLTDGFNIDAASESKQKKL